MFRAVVLALIVGLALEAGGLATVCADQACADDCSGGECAPNCHSCACCSFPKTIVTGASVTLSSPPSARIAWRSQDGAPPSADPSDIFHVPKRLLA